MAKYRILETQPAKTRLVLPVSSRLALIVTDDPELIEDPDYAPGVMKDLKKSWRDGDYFTVSAVNSKGEIVDSVSSMAGYGGPRKAAEAALRDYFKSMA